ncbi:MAG: tetratricopeptide repeat protein, partial [Deltaproteobacteria bacterium]
GEIWDARLSQPDQAIDSYCRALSLNPSFVPALESLREIYLRSEQWEEFIEVAEHLAALSEEKQAKFELFINMAEVFEKELVRIPEAIRSYQRAIEIDPDHVSSRENLAELLYREDRLEEASLNYTHLLKLLPKAEAEKTLKTILKIARIESQLGVTEAAIQWYQSSLEIKPDCTDALKALGDMLYRESRWDEVMPIYAKFLETVPSAEDLPNVVEINYRMAKIEEQLDQREAAANRYQKIIELDSKHLSAWENLANLHYQAKKWRIAKSTYERWLSLLPEEEERPETATVYCRLGVIEEKLDDPKKAILKYQKALDYDPKLIPALEASIRLYQQQEDWENLIRSYQGKLKITSDPSQVFTLNYELGQLLEEKALRMEEATSCYRRALEINPNFRPALERLFSIYLWLENHDKGAEVLLQLVHLEKDPEKLKKYHLTLGDIYEKWLFDNSKAAHYYQELLKLDPASAPAKEALSRVFEHLEDWEGLAPIYKEMLDSLPADSPDIIPLSLKLAEIYAQGLSDFNSAELLLRQLLVQHPKNPEAHLALGELYYQHDSSSDKAIEQFLWVLDHQPLETGPYRALARLYDRLRLTEQAKIMYSLLILIDPHDKISERQFKTKSPSHRISRGQVLDDRKRERYLLYPGEKSFFRQILYPIAEFLPQWGSINLGSFELEQAHLVNEGFNPSLKRVWDQVVIMLNPPTASLYLEDQGEIESVHLSLMPSAIVFNLSFLRSLTEKEGRFILGRCLEHLKNKHHFYQAFPQRELWKIIASLRSLHLSERPATVLTEPQEKLLRKMLKTLGQSLSDKSGKKLALLFKSMKEDKFSAWFKFLEHTANRAGLLACSDPLAAFSALIKFRLKREEVGSELKAKGLKKFLQDNQDQLLEEEIRELLRFCVSPDYLLLRRELGIR